MSDRSQREMRRQPRTPPTHTPAVPPVPVPARRYRLDPGECAYCDENAAGPPTNPVPPHDPSRRCQSGGRNHCTCDTCF